MRHPSEGDAAVRKPVDSAGLGEGERRARPPEGRAGEERPWPLLAHLLQIAGEVQVLARVRSDGARLRRRRALASVQAQIFGGAALVTAAVYGACLLVSGLTRVLDGLFEQQPGLGRLLAGAAILIPGALGLWLRGTCRARLALKQARAKYARHT